ncbi:head protein [Paracoccus sediminis]|uniref:Head protein n=1 Tax=Paracoccus sediminis TaxID=1214787 RepID=A0A238ULJ6_9RHOB|nr:Mu-like prophage major head subunit gpT family protein [Paracoccus sediminis]TBN53132.1 head protein [Paracoccus sediminis]SNR22905.1 Mu-like prophage major head subunit gpT [Paracoccus sediminis]
MAIITPALLVALNTVLQKAFKDAYAAARAEAVFERIATTVPSSTATNTYSWLGDFPTLQEWVGERVLRDMKAHGYQVSNRLYEATLGVARTAIEDDQYGHYGTVAASMGQEAAQHPDKIIAALMAAGTTATCYDGQYFFDTDHPVYPNVDGTGTAATVSNYDSGGGAPGPAWYLLDTRKPLKPFIFQERTKPEFEHKTNPANSDQVFMADRYVHGIRYRCNGGYGFWQMAYCSKAALSVPNFVTARDAMAGFKADGGRPLGMNPNVLVVPRSLRSAADELIAKANLTGGESNVHYKAVDTIVSDWL